MNCANHSDVAAVAFCRTCGKPLCQNCTRDVRGVIYCESCLAARMEGVAPAAGYVPGYVPPVPPIPPTPGQPGYQQFVDPSGVPRVVPATSSGPNPALAGILAGFFPFGVGAVYCSQYAKGLAHLLIFVFLIFGVSHGGSWDWLFGFGIAFFVVYQIIDAVRTAKALQLGQPAPDPLGLGQTFGGVDKFESNKVPVGAVVLIGLGVLFLLNTMGVMESGFERYWPLILIFLGGWMFYRNWERNQRTCTCGRCRTRWLMGPSMVLTTGVLMLLQSLDIAELGRTWPAWLLVVGIVKLLQSSASAVGHVGPLPPGPANMPPIPPVASSAPTAPVAPESTSGEVNHV
ncbi:MAG TPA: B-box zinc finger protein [Candidatus Sulfotelmatobacter sp.]